MNSDTNSALRRLRVQLLAIVVGLVVMGGVVGALIESRIRRLIKISPQYTFNTSQPSGAEIQLVGSDGNLIGKCTLGAGGATTITVNSNAKK